MFKYLKSVLEKEGVDGVYINHTNEFFSEYVDISRSSRFLLSGFSGSTGDALITSKKIYLFVDSRYWEQAENEVDKSIVEVITTLSETNKKIPISYKRFRAEIIDFCGEDFLGCHPKKYINKALSDLRSRGIGIEFPSGTVRGLAKDGTRESNEKGFYICCLTDGHLMASALPK